MGVLIGLSHCRHYLPDGVIKVLVTALVLSRIGYCLSVYGNGTQKNLDRLLKILNFAVRVIFGKRKFDHVSDLREQLRWMMPRQMMEAQTLTLAYKVLRWGEPESLADAFTRCRDHEHLNRLDYDICVITETWLRPATASRLVTFPGYTLHRADRPGDAGYGGVAILVKDSYTASVIPQPASDCAACRLESLWLRVKPATGRQFSIAAVYRPPRRTVAAVQADLDELLLTPDPLRP
ncbi:hypothetical protein FJT64_013386 [Amphibalanus amphitrite]|uniref:Endonuclease/exonuclease/phosphatase domain-containing protein n=1 Tax=Amphibalanus amphitrite TaxID=1232801 RepID=A0A6A4V9L5_AMPAM|nr:hypothetical protein FJT64_013386 [Amphibalanus amphitrite]